MKSAATAVLALLAAFATSVYADTEPPRQDDAREHDTGWLLGTVFFDNPQFAGSRDTRQTAVLPWLAIEGERGFVDTSVLQAGFSIWKSKISRFDLLVQPRYGFEPDNDPLLVGLDGRGTTAEAGARVQWSTHGYTAQLGYYTGLGGATAGQAAEFTFSYLFSYDRWSLVPQLKWRREDSALVNHQYGIGATRARADRPMYAGEATTNTDVGLTVFHEKPGAWVAFGGFTHQRVGGGIRRSPIVDRNDGFALSVGVGWIF